MTDYLPEIPARLRIDDRCDFCRREFAWARGSRAICLSCGLENPRPVSSSVIESGMLRPAQEEAILPRPRARKSAKGRK